MKYNLNRFDFLKIIGRGASTFINGFAAIINAFIRFLVLFLGARLLSVEDYGLLDTFLFAGLFLSVVISLGIDSAILRLSFKVQNSDVVSTSLFHTALILVIFIWLSFLTISYFIITLNIGSEFLSKISVFFIPISFFSIGFSFMSISSAHLRARFENGKFFAATVIGAATRIVLIAAFTLFDKTSLSTFLLHVSLGYFFAGAFFVFLAVYPLQPCRFDSGAAIRILKYGAPLSIVVLLVSLVPLTERFMVLYFFDEVVLSVYAASAFPALLMGIVVQIVNLVWTPLAFKCLSVEFPDKFFLRNSIISVHVFMLSTFIILLFTHNFLIEKFLPSLSSYDAIYFPFMGMLVITRLASGFASFGLLVERKTLSKAIINALGLGAGLVAAWFFASRGELSAVPMVVFVCYFITFVVEGAFARYAAPEVNVPFVFLGFSVAFTALIAFLFT